ncbi:prohibitin family protein [Herpetosiphon gulosus]|uniref:Band 7 domain-containing protein n=1 Tax=Herpetosiphon gulosus TaxID=1973496 RepID=A0ABP9WVJ4_9CHLR
MTSQRRIRITPQRIIAAIIALMGVLLLNASWRTIAPGSVGIAFNRANNTITAYQEPGWVLVNPFTTTVYDYPATLQTYVMVQKADEGPVYGDDSIKVQSRESQQLNLDVAIQYRVNTAGISDLYTDWGGQSIGAIEEQVVRQQSRSALTMVASTYSWEELSGEKRADVADQVEAHLTRVFAQRHLILEDFVIREVHVPEHLKTALDNKIERQQAVEQQQYAFERAQIQAEQQGIEAEGQANVNRATAQGDSDALMIRAQSQAKANQILSSSLTEALLKYQLIERWDGQVPLSIDDN